MNTWKNEPNNKGVLIVRRSSHGQKDNTSEASQIADCKAWCEQHGIELVEIIPIIESAYRSKNRTKHLAAKRQAKKLKVKHIIYHKSDRGSRNLTDAEGIGDSAKKGDFIFHFVTERVVLHKDSPDSDFLMLEYQAIQNKHYSRDLSSKVSRAVKAKAESGWWPYRHTPLGYFHKKDTDDYGNTRKGTAKLTPGPTQRDIDQVNREFELRAQALTYDEIAENMIAEGWITKAKQKHYRSTLTKRLKNPLYWGYFYLTNDETRYEGKHEQIIPKDILKKVEQINSSNSCKRLRPNVEQGHFSGGFIKCADPECGCQITYDPTKKKIKSTGQTKTYHYYRCANGKKVHKKRSTISEESLLNQFGEGISAMSITEEFAKDIAEAINETRGKQKLAIKKQMEGYRVAIAGLDEKLDRAYDRRDNGELTRNEYEQQKARIRLERDDYTNQLESLSLQIGDEAMASVEKVFQLAINAESLWKSANPKERAEKLKQVVSNPVLDGLTLQYQLQKPFATLAKMKGNKEWRRERDSNSRDAINAYTRSRRAHSTTLPSLRVWNFNVKLCF